MRVLMAVNPTPEVRKVVKNYSSTLIRTNTIETHLCTGIYNNELVKRTAITRTECLTLGWVYEKAGQTIEFGAQQFHNTVRFKAEHAVKTYLESYRGGVTSLIIDDTSARIWVGSRDGHIDHPLYSIFTDDNSMIFSDSEELLIGIRAQVETESKIQFVRTDTLITVTQVNIETQEMSISALDIKR